MSNKTFEAPSIADLIQLAVNLNDSLTPEQHVDTLRGWPDMPSVPGLYALVAPDGITVRVFSLMGGDLPRGAGRDQARRGLPVAAPRHGGACSVR